MNIHHQKVYNFGYSALIKVYIISWLIIVDTHPKSCQPFSHSYICIMQNILAICGSTRAESSNHRLIGAIKELYAGKLNIVLFESISLLPHFNPDLADDHTPDAVKEFRQKLRDADGVLICTPEYAHGIPGSLKNAIDWTVSSNEFSQKPVVLITASTDGKFAHTALLEILRTIETKETEQLQLLIPFVQTKISKDSLITDEKTLEEVKAVMEKLISMI